MNGVLTDSPLFFFFFFIKAKLSIHDKHGKKQYWLWLNIIICENNKSPIIHPNKLRFVLAILILQTTCRCSLICHLMVYTYRTNIFVTKHLIDHVNSIGRLLSNVSSRFGTLLISCSVTLSRHLIVFRDYVMNDLSESFEKVSNFSHFNIVLYVVTWCENLLDTTGYCIFLDIEQQKNDLHIISLPCFCWP